MSVSTKCEHAYKGCTYRIQIQKLYLLIMSALSLIWPKTWLAADLQFRLPEVRHAADRRTCDQQFLSRRSIRLGYRPFFLSRSQSLIGKERAASTSRSPIRAVQGPVSFCGLW